LTPKLSREMPHYMFCSRKKIISRTFKISGTLIVNLQFILLYTSGIIYALHGYNPSSVHSFPPSFIQIEKTNLIQIHDRYDCSYQSSFKFMICIYVHTLVTILTQLIKKNIRNNAMNRKEDRCSSERMTDKAI
jgi:hypothetical protein